VKPNENPETRAAVEQGIPIIRRAEMLAEVARLNYCLGVSGTHGKTTTTSMLGLVLIKAGLDPTVIVGGRLRDFGGTNARLGNGDWTLVEADEYDRSFLQLDPTIAVINNIEPEHLDIYEDFDDIKDTFTEFGNKVPFYGFTAVGLDDAGVKAIYSRLKKKVITFGLSRNCDVRGDKIFQEAGGSEFSVYWNDKELGRVKVQSPGIHNVKNALGTIAVALNMGIPFDTISAALSEFHGVYRRFDIKGEKDGVMVVDDYAHHPTEVRAALSAARNGWNRRIVAAFQPHTFTRTAAMHDEFAQSFDDADVLIITDVYPAREKPIPGVDGKMIADAAEKYGHRKVIYIPKLEELNSRLKEILKENDMFITIGAGNICDAGTHFLEK
jgi:UDP-N-acetylmuramate--alanine ligase